MAVELVPGFFLRKATAEDHSALLSICLQTGDSGADATGSDADGDLVGLYYAVPYQVLEPAYCFVITREGKACGYVMGTADTAAFNVRFEREWLPPLRKRIAKPTSDQSQWKGFDWVRYRIHCPAPVFNDALMPYPAQGHIDLLPPARGKGVGKAAMLHLMARLSEADAKGIHLHVSPRNHGAQAFYRNLGFRVLHDDGFPVHTVFMVRSLP